MYTFRLILCSVLLCLSLLHVSRCLDYSDIEGLGQNCPDRFTCSAIKRRQSFSRRNCECDADCSSYDDCCIDAKYANHSLQNVRPKYKPCLPYGGHAHLGAYVVDNCASDWSGSQKIRQKCVGPTDFRDPLNAAPLTSMSQGRTFRNRYCAECNGGIPSDLLTWRIHLECEDLPQNISESNVLGNMEWNDDMQEWGVYRWNLNRRKRIFYPCELMFDIPPLAKSRVRKCRPGLVSSCQTGWARELVKRKCEAYMAVVYSGSAVYRNPHCAVCNNLTVDKISCEEGLTNRRKKFSFALLLDFDKRDGDEVNEKRPVTPQCPSGEIYDPFFKTCHEYFCALPGYKVRNGKCHPD